MFRGRYLNGEADFKASLIRWRPHRHARLDRGQRPNSPRRFHEGIRKQNLAKDVYKDEKNAEMIRKLESLEVKDGKIILKVRAKGDAPSPVRRPPRRMSLSRSWLRRRTASPRANRRRREPQGDEPKTEAQPAATESATPKTRMKRHETTMIAGDSIDLRSTKPEGHHMIRHSRMLVAVLVFDTRHWAWSLVAAGASRRTRPKKVASVEGITEYRLDNGLRVLLFPDPTRPKVTVNLTVLVGSRHEGYGETGMAHLLEHMVFKGTPTHPDIPGAMKERGAQFNGSTWRRSDQLLRDFARHRSRTSSSPSGSRPTAWSIARSRPRTSRPSFPWCATSLNRAKTRPSACCRSGWRRSPTSGTTTASRRSATAPTSSACRSTTCGPSTRSFTSPTTPCWSSPASSTKRKHLNISRNILALCPGPTASSPRPTPKSRRKTASVRSRFAGWATSGLVGLALSRSGRLACRVPRGGNPGQHPRVRAVGAALQGPGRVEDGHAASRPGPRPATIRARSRSSPSVNTKDPATLEKVRDVMLSVLDDVARSGVTQEEVDRARQKILKNRELAAADPNRIAVELSEWGAQGDWRLYFLNRDRIEQVTPAQVKEVADKYFGTSNRTVGFFIPTAKAERTPIPAVPDIAKLVDGYTGRQIKAESSETADVDPLAIEARVQRPEPIAGVKLAFLPKKTRGESVQLRLTLHYGNAENLKGLNEAASFLQPLMSRETKSLNRQQIQDALDKNFARLGWRRHGQGPARRRRRRRRRPGQRQLLGPDQARQPRRRPRNPPPDPPGADPAGQRVRGDEKRADRRTRTGPL